MDLDPDACYRAISTRDARFDGRFFTGVRTTGIYCRPICPARTPKRENVRFFPSAAAAQEAGFRPCLRCRPEASPDMAAWRGTSNTVSRALALIAEGALDDVKLAALAERLGLGERQLRRLFRQHLGASPIAVAQTRRVLFAKQLIVETAMPLTEVALAAGFGSIRRFNATFQTLYRRPPGELRRRHRGAPAAEAVNLFLPFAPPYDWAAMIGFLQARAITGIETVEAGCYRRSIALDGVTGSIAVTPAAGGNGLRVEIRFPHIPALAQIVHRIRRVFDLSADPVAIGADLARDPLLASLVAARPGLRVPGAWDGFETAIRAVLGQQITVGAAVKLAGKLVAAHGERLTGEHGAGLTHVFPTPARLASAELQVLGMPGSRAATLKALAAAAAADPALFGTSQTLEAALARLQALGGIGDWTAHYIAMRALREPDAFPASDIGLQRAAAMDGKRPSAGALLARAEAWRPWRAYAAQHLWTLDAETQVPISAKPKDDENEATIAA